LVAAASIPNRVPATRAPEGSGWPISAGSCPGEPMASDDLGLFLMRLPECASRQPIPGRLEESRCPKDFHHPEVFNQPVQPKTNPVIYRSHRSPPWSSLVRSGVTMRHALGI